jgi:N-acetylglucosaminyldiphosphoundecaprenol N-acetyl-beta-D-mannosaminyltransferase
MAEVSARACAWTEVPETGTGRPLPTVGLLGLDFADADMPTVVSWLGRRAADAPFGYVVTPNADHLVRISRDPSLLPVYRGALLRLMDSTVVARAARLLGMRAAPIVRGTDLAAALVTRHLEPGERLTVIGMQEAFVPTLRRRCPGVEVVHHNPPMGFDRDPEAFAAAVRFAVEHPARFTVLAVGMPRQERLAAAIAETGRARGVGLCVGSALEFLVGAHRRAPRWVQEAGFEWLYRMAREPRRLARRYLVQCPPIFGLLLRERRTRRRGEVA